MDRLKNIRNVFITQVESQLGNLTNVNAAELGEVVDMVKDMEEAMCYHMQTKVLEEQLEEMEEEEHKERKVHYYPYPYYEDYPMYYTPKKDKIYYHHDMGMPLMEDEKEGKSGKVRKTYIENKHMHADKATQLKELEKYVQELSQDLVEMVEGSSPEEKQLLQQKISTLAAKIK